MSKNGARKRNATRRNGGKERREIEERDQEERWQRRSVTKMYARKSSATKTNAWKRSARKRTAIEDNGPTPRAGGCTPIPRLHRAPPRRRRWPNPVAATVFVCSLARSSMLLQHIRLL